MEKGIRGTRLSRCISVVVFSPVPPFTVIPGADQGTNLQSPPPQPRNQKQWHCAQAH